MDREKVINLFIKYFKDRVFYLKYPANSVYIDGKIFKKLDVYIRVQNIDVKDDQLIIK